VLVVALLLWKTAGGTGFRGRAGVKGEERQAERESVVPKRTSNIVLRMTAIAVGHD